ncbi:MAG: peptidoglycan DD-metalloendopeptidase family protein [Alphaproteobacteria bacterium]|nr:peptidoglycan DD-metalloendopeptidase family protein [Alphaproteobacteria bacterium]MBQ8256110.1 peptidoglycan DD-metalloendopeptidase family protein [Alphaproteobacteria bacterium]
MKKAKNIMSTANLTRMVMALAVLLSLVAIFLVVTKRTPAQLRAANECKSIVMVASGDTLSELLLAQGLSHSDVNNIAQVLKKEAEISTLRADRDRLEFVRDADDAPVSKIVVVPSPWRQVELTCNDSGDWDCKTVDIERDTRAIYRSGEILDGDSFYLAGQRAGIPAGILIEVYDLLAFEMDFERDVRAGQKFSVLYEENFSEGEKIDNGNVLAVSFQALRGNVQMYRYRKSDGTIGYYDAEGNGAIKSLKRTPINNAKITSNFSRNRKHPILGYTRAHKGVDFRASTGTPIPAAGAGRVVARSYNRGHGNFVKIRHNGSYETLYAHMSKFAKGVNVGTTVRQGQTIGYVGSTGYSTGPHLHYEIIKDGVHVNPMTVKLPAISNLNKEDKKKFKEYRKVLEEGIEQLEKNPSMYIQL